jgi:hypothetical protein
MGKAKRAVSIARPSARRRFARLLFLQRIDIVVEADFRSSGIDKMKIDFAAGLQRLDASCGKAKRRGAAITYFKSAPSGSTLLDVTTGHKVQ